jgi:hypothetical protein
MQLITVDEFVPELHANAKYCTVSVEEAGDWWAARIAGRTDDLDHITLAIISTMVFFGIVLDEATSTETEAFKAALAGLLGEFTQAQIDAMAAAAAAEQSEAYEAPPRK